MKSILIVAPHPDDETLGCGGLIARSISQGCTVKVVVLTKGEKLFSTCLGIHTDPSPQEVCDLRRAESVKAVAIFGMAADEIIFWDFPDSELEQRRSEVAHKLAALINEIKPDEIYCTNTYELHPDHRAAAAIVDDACAMAGGDCAIRHYFITLPPQMSMADIALKESIETVDISGFVGMKKKAVAVFDCHLKILSSQQSAPILADYDMYLNSEEIFIVDGKPTNAPGRTPVPARE